MEKPQFTDEERLRPMIAVLSVVAVFLVQLRDAAWRPDAATRQATELVSPAHGAVLSRWRWGVLRSDLTVPEFCLAVARLGGHPNRKCDGPPGWITWWRGWMNLQDMVDAVAAVDRARSGQT